MTIQSRKGSERLVFLIPILIAVALAGASYRPGQINASAAISQQGLVGYWSFDEGSGTQALDGSGNANNGTLLNGPVWQSPAACKTGGCLKFDGSNDWVKVNNSSSLQVTGDLTISIWIKPTAVSARQVLVHKSREFHLGYIETTAPFRLKWHHASEAASGYVTNSINTSQWQHIVLVRDNTSKQIRGYKNGALEVTSSYTVNPTLSSNPVGIGSRYSGGEYFNGFIDEVRIYNRTLTEAEILELFNLTPDTTPPSAPTGLNATAASATQISLSWNAATDDVGVSGYRIYRDGAEVGTAAGTTYQDTGLTASTTYSYTVAAFDGSGNLSAQSTSDSATTLAADTNPPIISAVSSSGVSSSSATITWTTNEAADTQVEYGTTTAYGQSTPLNGALVTSHSQTLSNLTSATTYHYRVKSRDGSNNLAVSGDHVFTTGSVAPQREDLVIASGLSNPTAMAIAPDGRIFVTLQGGSLRVIKNESLLSTPFLTVPVTSNNERGLLGIAFDPGFATNRYIYIYYTATSDPVVNRVSRFRASSTNPDVAESGSETIILNDLPSQTGWHNGGAIHFGNDGNLYIAVGEGHSGSNAQSFTTLAGKLLRINPASFVPGNPSAMIPTDNPFYTTATGINRAIWALGLRNPFTFDIQPTTGRIFINNVGENTWEEINEAWVGPNNGSNAGFNFGWPTCEGPQGTGAGNCTSTSFKYPFYSYRQQGGTCAITGGVFYNPTTVNFPGEYVGDYFFADYCAGWIKSIDLTSGVVTDFITGGINDPVDLKVSNNGILFYLSRNGGSGRVNKVSYLNTNQPPSIVSQPADANVTVGQSATFSVAASGTNPLSYQWQRNGSVIAGATAASYTLLNVQPSDNGALFRVIVSNAHGTATSNSATLTVSSNQAPTGTIVQPAAGALFSGGETINFGGTASDPEDGTLSPGAFTWRVDFHHETHVHPFIPDTTGSQAGSFTATTSGHTEDDVWYRIHLTVRDSDGLSHSSFRDVVPRTVNVTLATNPPGLQVTLDAQPKVSPHSFVGVVGIDRSLSVSSPQVLNGVTYEFVSWSDGGSQSHTISTPATDTTYVAEFREASTPPIPTAGLIGYWSFNEGAGTSANDGSGNGNNGSLTYGPTWAAAASCRLGGCLQFDGVDDYVRVLSNAQLSLVGDLTISAWIRPTGLGTKQSIVSKRYEFELGYINDTPPYALKWSHKNSSGSLIFDGLTTSIEANQWQHVVLVRNGATKQIKGYKNGILSLVTTYVSNPGTNSYNVNIGRNPGGTQRFKGFIDEVRIYNRVLSDSEVTALFNQ